MAKTAAANGKKGRAPAPANEDKSAKFRRIATQRVQKAVKALQTIGNLSSPTYERTDEQVEKINTIITDTWSDVMAKFNAPAGKTQNSSFSL